LGAKIWEPPNGVGAKEKAALVLGSNNTKIKITRETRARNVEEIKGTGTHMTERERKKPRQRERATEKQRENNRE
jgi:hypothetical protein